MHSDNAGQFRGVRLGRDGAGRSRAQEDIDDLHIAEQAIAAQKIALLGTIRFGVDSKKVKHIRRKLWEYKFDLRSGSYRAFFYIEAGQAVIIRVLQKKKQKFTEKELRDIEGLIPD